MAVMHAPESAHSKEMAKWEAQYTQAGPPGRLYEYRPYPATLFKAGRLSHGPLGIVDTVVVEDRDQAQRHRSRGYYAEPLEAIQAKEAEQVEFARLAAERNYDVKFKLSPQAAAEVAAAEDTHGSEHLPMIPETPIQRRQFVKTAANVAAKRTDPNAPI